ncbi:cytochrome oxidase putative small subunit CydP [Variovorax sp. YR752]|uniref:cytochrome oxidase putative small subunit CydP n=1 Tax=Variovorax sp. YR752 TaxID=1884383 RepID=UPI003137F06A
MRHLVIAVALKLLVLIALWWAFVRDDRIAIDVERAASHLGSATAVHPGEQP